jgi:hypothetical protein
MRMSGRRPSARFWLGAILLSTAVTATAVDAQSTLHVTPSVGVSAVYDENILFDPQEPRSDHLWRVEPQLSVLRQAPRSRLWLESSLSASRYSRNRGLSSALARQFTTAEWSRQTTSVSSLRFTGSFASTTDPADVDPSTGWSLGRVRTWRWMLSPQYEHALGPRFTVSARYRANVEQAATVEDLITNTAAGELQWRVDERNDLRFGYGLDRFGFGSNTLWSQRPAVYWVHRFTPLTQVMLGGGARVTGSDVTPAIEAAASRQAGPLEAAVSYTWDQVASLGADGLIEVQRVLATMRYGRRDSLLAGLHGGVYVNSVGRDRIDIYRAGLDVERRLWGPLAIAASVSVDFQRAPVSRALMPTGELPFALLPALPDPDGPNRRSVAAIRLVLVGPSYASTARAEQPLDLVRDPHRGGSNR